MSEFAAGPAAGSGEDGAGPWGGGSPPPVLLAALGIALLIAVVIVAFLIGSGGGSGSVPVAAGGTGVDDPGQGKAPAVERRVLLSLSVEGGGSGRVRIGPRGDTCVETCEHQFSTGTRVTVTADATDGSRFEGWDEACTGQGRCSFFMDRDRSLTATFEGTPAGQQCTDGKDNDGDGFVDDADPGCKADGTEAPDNRPAGDCHDGRDNDGDGLIDTAQDPGCTDGTEADPETATAPAPPPPPAPALPPATTAPQVPPAAGGTPPSECHDGIDNDGDHLTDRPADPGCDADGTEAGG
ncbi:MAG: hypothetical protein QOE11_3524 [Solirubrobacteraceae bacterium]|jgi:hypothetical protein|nr:hypothetical protein [Solirubrobacteraceae bacterium]